MPMVLMIRIGVAVLTLDIIVGKFHLQSQKKRMVVI